MALSMVERASSWRNLAKMPGGPLMVKPAVEKALIYAWEDDGVG